MKFRAMLASESLAPASRTQMCECAHTHSTMDTTRYTPKTHRNINKTTLQNYSDLNMR